LIDHHHFIDAMPAGDGFARANFLAVLLTLSHEQIPVEHIVNQGGLAGTRDAGNAGEDSEWQRNVNVLQIVFARSGNLDG
jgi:hypothetical protein